jgi:hypothetical protein
MEKSEARVSQLRKTLQSQYDSFNKMIIFAEKFKSTATEKKGKQIVFDKLLQSPCRVHRSDRVAEGAVK